MKIMRKMRKVLAVVFVFSLILLVSCTDSNKDKTVAELYKDMQETSSKVNGLDIGFEFEFDLTSPDESGSIAAKANVALVWDKDDPSDLAKSESLLSFDASVMEENLEASFYSKGETFYLASTSNGETSKNKASVSSDELKDSLTDLINEFTASIGSQASTGTPPEISEEDYNEFFKDAEKSTKNGITTSTLKLNFDQVLELLKNNDKFSEMWKTIEDQIELDTTGEIKAFIDSIKFDATFSFSVNAKNEFVDFKIDIAFSMINPDSYDNEEMSVNAKISVVNNSVGKDVVIKAPSALDTYEDGGDITDELLDMIENIDPSSFSPNNFM